jgi:hypothetical protein
MALPLSYTPDTLRDALLADQVGALRRWLSYGADPNIDMGPHGGTPLHHACTPAMVRMLLAAGADPMRVRDGGVSTLDAAAREGQTGIAAELLRAAPQLATEERALLAADHPETEALIRSVARGESVDSIPATAAKRLTLSQIPTVDDPRAPGFKGAQRYYSVRAPLPTHAGELLPHSVPGFARPHLTAQATAFTGAHGAVFVFDPDLPPVLLTRDAATTIDAPPVKFPFVYAYDASGRFAFFGYGQGRVLGFDVVSGASVVDLELPGAPWGSALVGLPGEDLRGHNHPARIAVVDNFLFVSSLERIHVVGFGEYADVPGKWFTCQLGTCAAPVLDGRIVIIGARSGSCVLGVHGRRVERLADLEAPAAGGPSALQSHLRMALRVSGQGLDDLRTLRVQRLGRDTLVTALGLAGIETGTVLIRGLSVDPAEVEADWPTAPEIVDAFELDGEVVVRVCPVGRDEVRSYRVDGLDALWDKAFGERTTPVAATGPGLLVTPAPLPAPYPPPHPSIETLSYPDVGPTGYAFGFKVSARPGLWNSYIVDADGTHRLSPDWFSGITMHAFHDTLPRMLAATGRELIEIDLPARTWQRREFDKAVRTACYFDGGLAVLLADELLLLPALDAEPALRIATTTRSAEMGSFHGHRVLCVPVGAQSNVFLARRDAELVVVGVLTAEASGYTISPDGEFLAATEATLRLSQWDSAVAAAPVWSGQQLAEIFEPRVGVLE